MAVSEKNIPTRNDMFQAMPVNNGFIAEPSAIILDEDGNNVNENSNNVTRDFTVLGAGVNTANIQVKLEAKNEQAELEKKKKQDQENIRDGATTATAELKEMMSFNGYEFSVEAMQETAGEALSDFERLMREKGWGEEQAETIHEALVVLHDPNSTDTQRDQALNNIDQADHEYGKEFAQKAEDNYLEENENKSENTSTASEAKLNQKNSIMADIEQGQPQTVQTSSFDLDKPESKITATFTDEVNNVGANAQSFSLDEAPQVAVTESSPATFSLDALS